MGIVIVHSETTKSPLTLAEEQKNETIYIYMHKNKINNKIYIGQTKNPQKRWRSGGKEYKPKENNKSRFWNAIQKYGWDNFEHIIIDSCSSREEANKKEIELIAFYDTTNPDKGYNISTGGSNYSFWVDLTEEEREEWRQKYSQRIKKLWQDEEYVRKQKEGMKKIFESEEYREKMSKILKEIWSDSERREAHKEKLRKIKGVPVMCIETQQVFNSISAANEYFKKSTRNTAINDFFRGKQKTAFGYTWKKITWEEYYDQIENNSNK